MKQKILLAFLVLLFVPIASAQVYKITDLGPLSPTAINFWGQVVGNLNGEAFIWAQFGGLKGLGKLPGGTSSYAASINDLGVVTGTADGTGTVISPFPSIPNQECSDLTQPFVWTPRNGMQGLGGVVLASDQNYTWCDVPFHGTSVNDRGQIVGYDETGPDSYQFAFLWTSTGGMTLFGGSWPPTSASGVSNTGQIVGQNATFALFDYNAVHATSWRSGVATDLGTLGGGEDVVDYNSSASGVSDLGQIVGWSTTTPISFPPCSYDTNCPIHAVLWSRTRSNTRFGDSPGDSFSAALKINLFGVVIGASGNTIVQEGLSPSFPEVIGRPFIWSKGSGMLDLNTLISASSGWVLNSATGINIWGQIVGTGTLNGESHGFLLTPRFF